MANLNTWYKFPKKFEMKTKTTKTKYGERTVQMIIKDTIEDSTLKIPISPYLHPEGMKELAVLSAEYKCNLAGFALVLVALLREREQKNTVTISYEDLAKFVKVSVKTVASTMKLLEEHKFFIRIGKQSYKISPKLAWFGNQVDWAVALQELEQNTQNEENKHDN